MNQSDMNVIAVDIGNTQAKLAFFQGQELCDHQIMEADELANLNFWKGYLVEHQADSLIYADVSSQTDDFPWTALTQMGLNVIKAKIDLASPITVQYQTPQTLGIDRYAAVVGAYAFYTISPPFLVIDLGTAVTYDYVDANLNFLGGAISPGLNMRAKALHEYTGKLPLVSPNYAWNQFLGQNTQESMLAGIQSGLLAEVLGMIQWYSERSPEKLAVFLTGGTAQSLKDALPIPHCYRPHLVLEGLVSLVHYATPH
jgi:type III pantothenate kinase